MCALPGRNHKSRFTKINCNCNQNARAHVYLKTTTPQSYALFLRRWRKFLTKETFFHIDSSLKKVRAVAKSLKFRFGFFNNGGKEQRIKYLGGEIFRNS